MLRANFFLFFLFFCFVKVWFGLYFVLYSTHFPFFKYILDSIKVILGVSFLFLLFFHFTLLIYSCFNKRYFGHLACASTRGLLFGSHALKQIYHWNKFRVLNIQYPIANDPLPKQSYIELGT